MSKLHILLIGNGGREHALAWKLAQSPRVEHVYVVPGNGGTAILKNVSNVDAVRSEDFSGLVAFAKDKSISLLIPGPEAPLVDGIADYFQRHVPDIQCFGPSRAAARMEGSKTFSKDFMQKHGIPTAAYRNFSDYNEAKRYLDSVDHDVVIKASGLAAGKGVIIPRNKPEAQAALKDMMLDKGFGTAGDEVVVEEFLEGDEMSILSFCDGTTLQSLPPAQDHKRIGDGDTGKNTGGMGTYAPTRIVSEKALEEIDDTILKPTIAGMKEEGYPFIGCLFTGLMITKSGPKVLEYNVRFGDPETQSVLPLLETDLAEVMVACTSGTLQNLQLKVASKFAATVVVAAGGYPDAYKKGIEVKIDSVSKEVILFHAGTTLVDGSLRTSGGRVLAATATAETLEKAVEKAYSGVKAIHFEGMQYRRDIAARALKR